MGSNSKQKEILNVRVIPETKIYSYFLLRKKKLIHEMICLFCWGIFQLPSNNSTHIKTNEIIYMWSKK